MYRVVLLLAAAAGVARADSSAQEADPLPSACVARFDELARTLSLRRRRPTREGGSLELEWTYGAIDCDQDDFKLSVVKRRGPATPWRSRRRGTISQATRTTHGLTLLLIADSVDAPDERARHFLRLGRAALNNCLQ